MPTEEEKNQAAIRDIEQQLNQLEIQKVESQLASFDDDMPPFDLQGNPIPDAPRPEQSTTFGEKVGGALEAGATVVTGATTGTIGGVVGAVSGLDDVIKSGQYGTPEGAKLVQKAFEQGMSNLTFAPTSKTGQRYLKNVGKVAQAFEPIAGLSQISALGQSVSKGLRPRVTGADTNDLSPLRETQRMLENDSGGGLSAYQTAQAGNVRNFMEHLGDLGILSEGRKAHRNRVNAITISGEMQKMVDGLDASLAKKPGDLGEPYFKIIQAGNIAAGELYKKDLEQIGALYGDIRINTKPIVDTIQAWKKTNSGELGTNLDATSLAVANEFVARLNQGKEPEALVERFPPDFAMTGRVVPTNDPHASVQSLIDFEAVLNNEISKRADFHAEGFNAVATRQLSELSSQVRASINDTYRAQGHTELADVHKLAKDTLGSLKDQILPKLTKGTIETLGSREDFVALGKALISTTNEGKVRDFMASIDVAHKTATKAGKELPLTAAEMKQSIRQSYLDNIFGDVTADPDSVFTNKYNKMKKDLGNKATRGAIQAVLGEEFPQYVKIVTALEHASREQKNNLFGFVVRGAQLGKILQLSGAVGAAAGGTAIAGGGIGVAAAVAVLAAPNLISWAATRPGVVRKLIKLNKLDLSDATVVPRLVAVQINAVIDALDEKDREFIIEKMKEKQLEVDSLEEQQ